VRNKIDQFPIEIQQVSEHWSPLFDKYLRLNINGATCMCMSKRQCHVRVGVIVV
jgi:hypothetical protein